MDVQKALDVLPSASQRTSKRQFGEIMREQRRDVVQVGRSDAFLRLNQLNGIGYPRFIALACQVQRKLHAR